MFALMHWIYMSRMGVAVHNPTFLTVLDTIALIHDSPVTNTITKYTYTELRRLVVQFAGALHNLGVEKGDRVIICIP